MSDDVSEENPLLAKIEPPKVDAKDLIKEIRFWINQEHSLISNRIGWLFTINAFLIAVYLLPEKREIATFIFSYLPCVGILLGLFFLYLIVSAIWTIQKMRRRAEAILSDKRFEVLRILDPDCHCKGASDSRRRSCIDVAMILTNEPWEPRWPCTHGVAMWATGLLPLVVLIFWVAIKSHSPNGFWSCSTTANSDNAAPSAQVTTVPENEDMKVMGQSHNKQVNEDVSR